MVPTRWNQQSKFGLYEFFSMYGIQQNDPWRVEYPDGRRDSIGTLEDLDSEDLPVKIAPFGERPTWFVVSQYFECVEVSR